MYFSGQVPNIFTDRILLGRDITRKRLSYLAMETIKEIQENGNRNISRIFDDSKTSIG